MIKHNSIMDAVLSFPLWGNKKGASIQVKVLLKNWLLPVKSNRFLYRKQKAQKCFLFFSFITLQAQIANYVSNGSFEQLNANASPYAFEATKYWGAIDTTTGSNVLFSTLATIGNAPNSSFGFQYPRSGNNFVGVQFYCSNCNTNPRLYPRNRLKQVLQAGKIYCAKYYVVNTNNNRVAINTYGMYFGDSSIDTISKCTYPITYLNPQVENTFGIITDTLNWVPITGTFVANGTEKYMVIGNFRSNAATSTLQLNTPSLSIQTADIYIDDVSVIDIDLPAYAGPDIWGIPFNTVYLGRPQDVGIDEACIWYHLPNTTTAIDTAAGISVTVATTTQTYMVKQDICGNIKYDTVIVYASGTGLGELKIKDDKLKIYPQPANEIINVELLGLNNNNYKIEIINNLGLVIREEEVNFKNNNVSIKTNELPNGVYLLNLKSDKSRNIGKRFVISR